VPAVETEPSGAAPEPSATSAPLDSWTDGPDEPVYRVARQQLLWWDARCRRGKEVWGFFVTTSGEHFEEVNGRGKGPSDHQVACWVCDFMSDPGQQEKGQLHPLLHRQETSATLSVDAGEVPPDLEAAAAAALLSWKEKPPSGRGLTGGHNHVTRYCSKSGMGCLAFHVAKWHPVELAQLKELLRVEPLPTLPSVRRGPKRKTRRWRPPRWARRSWRELRHWRGWRRQRNARVAGARATPGAATTPHRCLRCRVVTVQRWRSSACVQSCARPSPT